MTLLDDELDGFVSLPMTLLDDELDSSSLSLLRMTLADEDELSSSTAIQKPPLQMCSLSLSAGFIIIPSLVTSQGISELRESELFSFVGPLELSFPQETTIRKRNNARKIFLSISYPLSVFCHFS
jgi:hypothetical protein